MTARLCADMLIISNDPLPLILGIHLIAIVIIEQSCQEGCLIALAIQAFEIAILI